jgi:hypothetical protein
MSERRHYKPALALLIAALIGVSGWSQRQLNHERAELGLTHSKPLENAPPVLAFTTVALGGFRGIIANILWVRAHQLQLDGKYFELIQLSDWITKLQPRIAMVWRYHAWNLSYNIPVKFPDNNDRWPWVRQGIELLRDEALRYNPHEITLYQEIGIIYQHKLGGTSDDAHLYYKYELAKIIEEALGGPKPDYDALLNPQTDDARERVRRLKEVYKLDPVIMKEVDDRYGPLEWRLPETHAIYWSVVGIKQSSQQDKLILRRTIYQSMQLAVQRGRMIIFKVSEDRNSIEFGPNLDMIGNANRVYEEMMEEQLKVTPGEGIKEHLGTGHRNFLVRVVHDLYLHNRLTEAQKWFEYMARKYPFEVEGYNTVDEYAIGRFVEEVGYDKPDQLPGSRDRIKAMVEGLLTQYYQNLAMGEEDTAIARERYARRIWMAHWQKISEPNMKSIVERVKLPPYQEIMEGVLQQTLARLTPYLQSVLLTRLGREAAPTNTAPTTVTSQPAPPAPGATNRPPKK